VATRTTLGSRLYCIPGLAFTMTIEDGVGLVIAEGGQVVGQTSFKAQFVGVIRPSWLKFCNGLGIVDVTNFMT
jgi:hypothetical protein